MRTARGAARRLRRTLGRERAQRLPAAPPAGGGSADRRRLLITVTPSDNPPESGWRRASLAELAGLPTGEDWDEVTVHAGSLADLRRATPWLELAGSSRRVTVTVARTDRPDALRPPATIRRRPVSKTRLDRTGEGGLRLSVALPKATEVAAVVRAALAAPGARVHSGAGLRLAVSTVTALPWAAGNPGASAAPAAAAAAADGQAAAAFDRILGPPPGPLPPVDVTVCSPAGFGPAGPEIGELSQAGDGTVEIRAAGLDPVRAHPGVGLTENDIRALRVLRAVRLSDGVADGPDGPGRVLSQLCCAGVPVAAPALPPAVGDALGPEVAHRLTAVDISEFGDPPARESWSIGTRRLALARFAPAPFWARHAPAPLPAPSVSAVLATRRPALLPFALAQIARQDWPELETVLVLHGVPATDPEVTAAVRDFPRPIQLVEVPGEVVFGHALNAGLARAAGSLVTKVDDDDWYGRHHVTDLVQAHGHSGATLIGAGGYHVYLAAADVTVRYTHVATEARTSWVHGGTMLIAAADLRALGGWRGVPVGEDAALLREVPAAGGAIYGIHDLGFTYYRGPQHTWNPQVGDEHWLGGDHPRHPGFRPPPQLDPLPHPWLG